MKEMFQNCHIKHKMLKLSFCLITVGGMAPHTLRFYTSSYPQALLPGERDCCIQWMVGP